MQSRTGDHLIDFLTRTIHACVRLLAILMTFVIVWGLLDVVLVIYQKLIEPPFLLLTINDMLHTFGAFMAVLIAIEIFVNITVYLRDDIIHVRIVIATALMAIARKVIVLDLDKLTPNYLYGIAAVVISTSAAYWIVGAGPVPAPAKEGPSAQ